MSELKPCPLCGGEVVFKPSQVKGETGHIEHIKNYCGVRFEHLDDTDEQHIEAWNQRQPHPDTIMLDWLAENNAMLYKGSTNYKGQYRVLLADSSMESTEFYDTPREAIQQAMEQEK